jgi:hypothetical protein
MLAYSLVDAVSIRACRDERLAKKGVVGALQLAGVAGGAAQADEEGEGSDNDGDPSTRAFITTDAARRISQGADPVGPSAAASSGAAVGGSVRSKSQGAAASALDAPVPSAAPAADNSAAVKPKRRHRAALEDAAGLAEPSVSAAEASGGEPQSDTATPAVPRLRRARSAGNAAEEPETVTEGAATSTAAETKKAAVGRRQRPQRDVVAPGSEQAEEAEPEGDGDQELKRNLAALDEGIQRDRAGKKAAAGQSSSAKLKAEEYIQALANQRKQAAEEERKLQVGINTAFIDDEMCAYAKWT